MCKLRGEYVVILFCFQFVLLLTGIVLLLCSVELKVLLTNTVFLLVVIQNVNYAFFFVWLSVHAFISSTVKSAFGQCVANV